MKLLVMSICTLGVALGDVVTDWNQFRNPDFGRMRRLLKVPLVFDGRNLYDPELVRSAGFEYFPIGRK